MRVARASYAGKALSERYRAPRAARLADEMRLNGSEPPTLREERGTADDGKTRGKFERGAGAWLRRAACLHEDPELFFPKGYGLYASVELEWARQVCDKCPVSTECLLLALATEETEGMWGGKSPEERRILKKTGGWRQLVAE